MAIHSQPLNCTASEVAAAIEGMMRHAAGLYFPIGRFLGRPVTIDASLPRRAAAQLVGTAALLVVVIGSGIHATALSRDTVVALIANSFASAIGLCLIITLFGPLSGAPLNPVITPTF